MATTGYKLKANLRPVRRALPTAVAFPSELDSDVLDRIEEFGEAAGLGKALVAEGDADAKHRDGLNAWFVQNSSTHWLYELVDELMSRANELWEFDLDSLPEPLQYTVYEPGHFYGWHWDQVLGTSRHRKLGLSLQLTASDKYAGGDLEIMEQDGKGHALPDAARDRGMVIAFPGWVLHQVTPVVLGTRKSLVAWAHGPRWK